MKIGVIGAGGIGQTYAQFWSAAGHYVFLSSRTPKKVAEVAREIGPNVQSGTPAEAAEFGEVILLAVNYVTLDEAIAAIAPHASGKLVIDATNPLRLVEGGNTERVIEDDQIAGLIMAEKLPSARIAKAFTTLWTQYVDQHSDVDDPRIAMTLAADAPEDRDVVASLIRDAGLVPVDLGTLAQSRPLDPPSPVWNVVLTPEDLERNVAEFRQSHQTT